MKTQTILLLLLLATSNAHSDTITAYCACPKCCGPNARGITASGKKVAVGMVAGPRRIPLGTKVLIGGNPYTVEDRTAKRYDGRWDIYFDNHKQALRFGKRELKVIIK